MDKITAYCNAHLPVPATVCDATCAGAIKNGGVDKVATAAMLPCTAALRTAMTAEVANVVKTVQISCGKDAACLSAIDAAGMA